MSSLSNPKLAAIDDALTELEPLLIEFATARGFVLARSHEGSFNLPRRWLHRDVSYPTPIRHEIGLIIALPMPERLERGFFPDIPCTLYIAAHHRETQMCYDARIFEAQPFSSLHDALPGYLLEAATKLDACTPDFISQYWTRNQTF